MKGIILYYSELKVLTPEMNSKAQVDHRDYYGRKYLLEPLKILSTILLKTGIRFSKIMTFK